jgi:hypothetical protein
MRVAALNPHGSTHSPPPPTTTTTHPPTPSRRHSPYPRSLVKGSTSGASVVKVAATHAVAASANSGVRRRNTRGPTVVPAGTTVRHAAEVVDRGAAALRAAILAAVTMAARPAMRGDTTCSIRSKGSAICRWCGRGGATLYAHRRNRRPARGAAAAAAGLALGAERARVLPRCTVPGPQPSTRPRGRGRGAWVEPGPAPPAAATAVGKCVGPPGGAAAAAGGPVDMEALLAAAAAEAMQAQREAAPLVQAAGVTCQLKCVRRWADARVNGRGSHASPPRQAQIERHTI